ncbi:hypothetical protein H632_c4686p0, partial [Helicosporidium sp. ATCC 50920]
MVKGAPATPAAGYAMVSVPEAVDRVLAATQPLAPVEMACADALGLTLAMDVVSKVNIPAYRASIKDGYAVLSSDGPGVYPVAFDAVAGTQPSALTPGSVAYVGTGGPVPE